MNIVYSVDYRVSNPVCYPRFRTLVSDTVQEAAFATGVPHDIYAFHRYTVNSTSLSCSLVNQYWTQTMVEPQHFKSNLIYHLRALYAQ